MVSWLLTCFLVVVLSIVRQGKRVLFLHTGGLLGMYDKEEQLMGLVSPAKRMDL